MNNRTLGRTGLKISEVGYGSWGLGKEEWLGADDSESIRALHRAFDLGLNFVDTALAYGRGHSERIVGRAVRDKKSITVASKIPPKNLQWPARRRPGGRGLPRRSRRFLHGEEPQESRNGDPRSPAAPRMDRRVH